MGGKFPSGNDSRETFELMLEQIVRLKFLSSPQTILTHILFFNFPSLASPSNMHLLSHLILARFVTFLTDVRKRWQILQEGLMRMDCP